MSKKIIAILCALSLLFALGGTGAAVSIETGEPEARYAEGQAIVCIEGGGMVELFSADGLSWSTLMSIPARSAGELSLFGIEDESALMLVTSADKSTQELIDELSARSDVVFAEPNYIYTLSESTGSAENSAAESGADYSVYDWKLKNTGFIDGGTAGVDVGNSSALEGSDDVVIAVLDSGVAYDHRDLTNMMVDLDEYPKLQADTGCGKYGYCPVPGEDASDPYDDTDITHGTTVAGTIGAEHNGIMKNVSLLGVRVFAKGSVEEYTSDIISAYDWLCTAKEYGVNIKAVNVSLGRALYSQSQALAAQKLARYGIVLCAATGNEKVDTDFFLVNQTQIESANMIKVNAMDADGGLSGFSNHGLISTDIFAPGSSILSPVGAGSYMFNSLLASQNTGRILAYNGFETARSDDKDHNPFALHYYDKNAPEGLGTAVNTLSAALPFAGNGSLELKRGAEDTVTLISKPTEITPPEGKAVFAGLFSKATGGGSHRIRVSFKLLDGSFSKPDSAETLSVSADLWSSGAFTLPKNTDYKSFQLMLTLDLRRAADEYTAYIDCLGLGTGYDAYAFINGTSFAAPCVTGAVGLLAAAYPDESAEKLAARIIGGAVKDESLYALCRSGGRLNIDKAYADPDPVVQSISIENGAAVLSGFFFGSAAGSVTVGGVPAAVTSWSDEAISIELPAGLEGLQEFKVTGAGEQANQWGRFYKEAALPANAFAELTPPRGGSADSIACGAMASIDGTIYFASVMDINDLEHNDPIELWSYDTDKDAWTSLGPAAVSGKPASMFAGGDIAPQLCAHKGRLYLSTADGELWQYDPKTYAWSVVAKSGALPFGGAIVSFTDKLLLCGGYVYDEENDYYVPSDGILEVSPSTGEAALTGTLPDTLVGGAAAASGGKLVILGNLGDESGSLMITEDLKEFELCSAMPFDVPQSLNAAFAPTANGIVVCGVRDSGGCDTWYFNSEACAWTASGRVLDSRKTYRNTGCRVGDSFYVWALSAGTDGNTLFRRLDNIDFPFADVSDSDWFSEDVKAVYARGLMDGVGGSDFSPNMTVTRAQAVAALWKLDGRQAADSFCPFFDVSDGDWFYDSAVWAWNSGASRGVSDSAFEPNTPVTRESLAALLYRYAQSAGADMECEHDLSRFADAAEVSDWAKDAVEWAAAKGILLGSDDNMLSPEQTASRAELAAVLMRFCDLVTVQG